MSKYFPLKADGFSQRIYCANGEVFANLPYCGDPQEQAARARMILALPELFAEIEREYTELADVHNDWPGRDSVAGQAKLCRLRDLICLATGHSAEDVQNDYGRRAYIAMHHEAASAFAEMMGSPEFPSIKGEQK